MISRVTPLYSLCLNTLVRWEHFQFDCINYLPCNIKEDILRIILTRGNNVKISSFLHPNIRKLDISGCDITTKELEDISYCTKIRVLSMNPKKFHRFDHPSLALETLFSRIHQLVVLHVQRNDGMTDSVVQTLTTNCLLLQELDVAGCTNITNKSAVYLSKLSYIQAINFSDTMMGDKGLITLSQGKSSRTLCEIKLNNCTYVSDEGINAFVKGCNRLSILLFCGCPKVSVDCQLNLDSFLGRNKKSKILTWTVYL